MSIEVSETFGAIATALLRFQALTDGVHRNSANPHFKSRYANLENVVDTARPVLQGLGVAFTQSAGAIIDGNMEMTTMLIHAETQQWMKSTMQIPLGKKDPQGAGSAQTYAQRYSLMAILGLPPTDDDGEMAIDRNNSRPEPDVPVKSSASLKRANSWEDLTNALSQDMVDVRSVVGLESVKAIYRTRAKNEGWPTQWMNALKDEFAHYEREMSKKNDVVDDIADTFGGATVTNERVMHPLMAGE